MTEEEVRGADPETPTQTIVKGMDKARAGTLEQRLHRGKAAWETLKGNVKKLRPAAKA